MNNIDMLISMFEEIKISQQAIASDIKKLETAEKTNAEIELPTTDEITDFVKRMISDNLFARISDFYKSDFENINLNIKKSNEQFENFLLSKTPKLKHQHTHFINFKSARFLIAFWVLVVACIISINLNFSLYSKSLEYEDVDWKYRFIKANKGVTGSELQKVEKAFDPNDRNEKAIEVLKKAVLKREKEITDKAQNLEYHEFIEK